MRAKDVALRTVTFQELGRESIETEKEHGERGDEADRAMLGKP